ncbi:MAG: type II toxin-antitoxin system RelE/ParE family toxin [Pseudomonadota bacterium]
MSEKPIYWIGGSKEELRKFPEDVIRNMGYQLSFLQHGLKPTDAKKVPGVGSSVFELREQDADGWYRVVYATVVDDAIGVLYCFQKKQNSITNQQMKTIKGRYQDYTSALKERAKNGNKTKTDR